MYYNSNKSNNDYYNAYKEEIRELEAYDKQETIQKIIKLIVIGLGFLLFIFASFYLYRYFYPTINHSTEFMKSENSSISKKRIPSIVIRESELPTSIQVTESSVEKKKTPINITNNNSNMNAKDIALIVQIIMSQMNTKKEISLEEQLKIVEKTKFENKTLKETNHYNKIILTSNKNTNDEHNQVQNSALFELTNNINAVLDEPSDETTSNYSSEIEKEVQYRTNEMRVIIVQKGDTLSRIAKKAYGNYNDYTKIFTANPEIIQNPDQIFIGQRLRIPS